MGIFQNYRRDQIAARSDHGLREARVVLLNPGHTHRLLALRVASAQLSQGVNGFTSRSREPSLPKPTAPIEIRS